MDLRDTIAQRTIERLRRFTERLEAGEPIKATIVTVESTPDGPLTTRVNGVFLDGKWTEDPAST